MKRVSKTDSVKGLEGCYIKVGHTAIQWVLEEGRYKWGSRDIHDSGTYIASQPDEFTCIVELSSEPFKGERKRICQITRRGKTFTVKESPNGQVHKFKRDDETIFLAEVSPRSLQQQSPAVVEPKGNRKCIDDATAAARFYLTGESVVTAATIPELPSSKRPTIIRVSHSNSSGRVDSDVFVRLGNPKKPLGVHDFDTVSDWRKADLVEDLMWNDKRGEWVPLAKAKRDASAWCGTFETQFQFLKGHHQIELKIISRVPEVCSIVLSNWKVYVR